MISTAGIWGMNLTKTFIIAKNTPASSMDFTPVIFNFERLGIKFFGKIPMRFLIYEFKFFKWFKPFLSKLVFTLKTNSWH
jgi:hypothetical protein